jgi:AcrR family transcriptional regulator
MTLFETVDGPAGEAADQPGRRHLSERQAEVMERLVAAAAAEAEEHSYGEITVRTIAKRAGVAPATAYTYFSGKDHLLAEVLWRRMQASPHLVDVNQPVQQRVAETVRSMGFGTMPTPAVAVCTTALLADGPDVLRVRSRLGAEISRRLAGALGPGFDPAVRNVLTVTYTGALLSAGMGHLDFDAVPAVMVEAVGLMAGDAAADPAGATNGHSTGHSTGTPSS